MDVDNEVSDIVKERGHNHGVAGAFVAGERCALQGVLDLSDRLAVGFVTLGFVQVKEITGGSGRVHGSPLADGHATASG
jgi:hypothetical protein